MYRFKVTRYSLPGCKYLNHWVVWANSAVEAARLEGKELNVTELSIYLAGQRVGEPDSLSFIQELTDGLPENRRQCVYIARV